MTNAAASRNAPECPRCGYDVSGVMGTWTNECPVEGRCSECGYGFQWRHLLGRNLGVPRWWFENARRGHVWAFVATTCRAWAPWRFWREVPLHAPLVPKRMVMLALGAVLVLYIGTAAALTTHDLAIAVFPQLPAGTSYYAVYRWQAAFGGGAAPPVFGDRIREFVTEILPAALVWPIRTWDFDVPNELGSIVAFMLSSMMIIPVGFLALPTTLSRHKVRWLHIVRAASVAIAVSAGAVGAWVAALWARSLLALWHPDEWFLVDGLMEAVTPWAILLWPGAMVMWWWMVCRMYLRIPQAFVTALLMNIVAVLGALVAQFAEVFDWRYWERVVSP